MTFNSRNFCLLFCCFIVITYSQSCGNMEASIKGRPVQLIKPSKDHKSLEINEEVSNIILLS